MDFVKREDNGIDPESYKTYLDSLQHTPISMEQLHQVVQSSLNSGSIMHNFQLPISPRQMSTLMMKTGHLTRTLNFNELPSHLPKNLTMEMDLPSELRHDDILGPNFARNLDLGPGRGSDSDIDIQNGLALQNLHEQELSHLSRISELSQNLRELRGELGDELCTAPTPAPAAASQALELALRLEAPEPRAADHDLFPLPFHIKSEQKDDGYFYDGLGPGMHPTLNGDISAGAGAGAGAGAERAAGAAAVGAWGGAAALGPLDLYSRGYLPGYGAAPRDDPQNLVIHKQYEHSSPFVSEPKRDDDGPRRDSRTEPKENLRPVDNVYGYSDYVSAQKNENDSSVHNKMAAGLAANIKGEYTCFRCNSGFPSKRALKQHAKTCDSGDADRLGKFVCAQCSYRCQSPAILKIHERTHTGEKPYTCTFCDYKSGQKNNVAKHILVHMKQKPFRCQYCDYRCAQKNNLVVHERTHTGYKPFACPYCDYRTVQKPNLVKHMYLHTDQKPFGCDVCSYRCVQKTNLTKHKQRHMFDKPGERDEHNPPDGDTKPYKPRQKTVKCPHCSYRCFQKASLEKHLQFKHSEVLEGCSEFERDLSLLNGDIGETVHNLSVKKSIEFHENCLEQSQTQS